MHNSECTGLRRRRCRSQLAQQHAVAKSHDDWAHSSLTVQDPRNTQRVSTSAHIGELVSREHIGLLSGSDGYGPMRTVGGCTHIITLISQYVEQLVTRLSRYTQQAPVLSSNSTMGLSAITEMKAEAYDANNLSHLLLLESLWKEIGCTDVHTPGVSSPDWASIGFQGRDPITDLRGLGLFGLRVLEAFTRLHRTEAAEQQRAALPFAITGLNLVALLERVLKLDNRICNETFRSCGPIDAEQAVERMAQLLATVWGQFGQFYTQSAAKMIKEGLPSELVRMHFSPICREYFQQWTGKDLGPMAVVSS